MRIRLPHKRFALIRTNHLAKTVVTEGFFWFHTNARRALRAARRREDDPNRNTWQVIPWAR